MISSRNILERRFHSKFTQLKVQNHTISPKQYSNIHLLPIQSYSNKRQSQMFVFIGSEKKYMEGNVGFGY